MKLPGISLLAVALFVPLAGAASPPAGQASFARDIVPFVTKYCVSCHGSRRARAGLNLTKYQKEESLTGQREVWEKVLHHVRSREMPPAFRRIKPTDRERDLVTRFLEDRIERVDCQLNRDPGRVTLRRLNRVEYNNTIRDLVGVKFQPAQDFPADDVGYGFDNIGDVLSLPPILMEKYLAAAEKIVGEAFKDPKLRGRIMIARPGKDDRAAARIILGSFARRAFRRPVKPEELERLVRFVDLAEKNGDNFETGIQLGLQATLVSPHFLFKVELDPPDSVGKAHPISDWELATRLSYFLWSSMPDEELFREAQHRTLRKNLEAQVRRMLRDPKAHALTQNFAGQWLQLRNLDTMSPNPEQFPDFNDALRRDMRREAELFFEAVLKEDRGIPDFLDADFTFLNERLARHYGIPGIKGEAFRRVKLPAGPRGGILTMAAVLTVTSNPTRTSPVKRGKWVLENILGTPPPPPPPDVPELNEDKQVVLSGTLRQRMEKHRSNPMCASCHQRMDPLGFGLENFDAVGAWRTKDGKFPIDASGVLPGNLSFNGPRELKAVLKAKKKEFAHCLTEKMLTYALGRGLEYYDRCAVDAIAGGLAQSDYKLTGLIVAVAKSEPFQMRRGQAGGKKGGRRR